MDSTEKGLLQLLESDPKDWSIRLLIVEKLQQRNAVEEAVALIEASPVPPENPEQLQKAVKVAGIRALALAKGFVAEDPSDGYGHKVLGILLELQGETEKAKKHLGFASALGFSDGSGTEPSARVEEESPRDELRNESQSANPVTPHPEEVAFDVESQERSGKRTGSKAVSVLVAIGVHVVVGVVAAFLVILHPTSDEPEIVASVIGPPKERLEIRKKNVVKQTKRSTSASSAAAPVARLMRANAVARFVLPEVTTTSTGPLGMGEGSFGSGGFGVSGGLGDGKSFMGTATRGQFAVVFDITNSMYDATPVVIKEINRAFRDAQVVAVFGGGFKKDSGRLLPYKQNRTVLATVQAYSAGAVTDRVDKALRSLSRCDSLDAKGSPFKEYRQSLGAAIVGLLEQRIPPGTIFVFSDFEDGVDRGFMKEVEALVRRRRAKVVFWYPFDKRQSKWNAVRKYYQEFVDKTGGELKEEAIK